MDGWTENLPILQDFVPYRGRCPATAQLQPKNCIKRGKGTADHMMPLGNWFPLFLGEQFVSDALLWSMVGASQDTLHAPCPMPVSPPQPGLQASPSQPARPPRQPARPPASQPILQASQPILQASQPDRKSLHSTELCPLLEPLPHYSPTITGEQYKVGQGYC